MKNVIEDYDRRRNGLFAAYLLITRYWHDYVSKWGGGEGRGIREDKGRKRENVVP